MGTLIVVGCTRSGDVVVLLDSTMRTEPVEAVALAANPLLTAADDTGTPPRADSIARLRGLDDSSAALDARFRALRDSISVDVRALDSADRRTRRYAQRYAEVRRRTVAAEALRGARDSTRLRADRLRARLGPRASAASARPAHDATAGSVDGHAAERHAIHDGALTLTLPPGRWWIGIARSGGNPAHYDTVTVRRGAVDTVHVGRRQPR